MKRLHRVVAEKPRRQWLQGAGLVAVLLGGGTAAAQVLISPVVVELGARQRAVAVTVSLGHKAATPLRLQAEVLRWQQDVHGQALTTPSDELLVTPPIAELQPGSQQVFRVTLRGARPAPEELAYRLILDDVSEAAAPVEGAPGMNISFRVRYDLPMVVAPVGPVVNVLRWQPCPPDAAPAVSGHQACVRLLNAGNRRVKVLTLTLDGDGWQQSLSLKDGENVLAGNQREWRVPLAAAQGGALRGVQVQTVRGETLQAQPGVF